MFRFIDHVDDFLWSIYPRSILVGKCRKAFAWRTTHRCSYVTQSKSDYIIINRHLGIFAFVLFPQRKYLLILYSMFYKKNHFLVLFLFVILAFALFHYFVGNAFSLREAQSVKSDVYSEKKKARRSIGKNSGKNKKGKRKGADYPAESIDEKKEPEVAKEKELITATPEKPIGKSEVGGRASTGPNPLLYDAYTKAGDIITDLGTLADDGDLKDDSYNKVLDILDIATDQETELQVALKQGVGKEPFTTNSLKSGDLEFQYMMGKPKIR